MNDLQTLNISLRNLDGPLPIQAVRLHTLRGVFYEVLGGEDSPQARSIHDSGGGSDRYPAPYTIGPVFDDGSLVGLRITTLQDRASPTNIGIVVENAWKSKQEKKILQERTIRVGSANMEILRVENDTQSSTTYEQIWDEAKPKHGLQLRFEMPARFLFHKNSGVLPIPQAVWSFYEWRWRTFSGITLPLEFLTWVLNQVHVTDATLETRLVPIQGTTTLSGIMGNVTYQAFREKKPAKGHENMVPESQLPKYLRAWQALAALAEYCGTGENANIGMGKTKVASRFGPYEPGQE
jgi:CRISPR/Cas system endoribonuclease Cas6 (RAMP superfamily)